MLKLVHMRPERRRPLTYHAGIAGQANLVTSGHLESRTIPLETLFGQQSPPKNQLVVLFANIKGEILTGVLFYQNPSSHGEAPIVRVRGLGPDKRVMEEATGVPQ